MADEAIIGVFFIRYLPRPLYHASIRLAESHFMLSGLITDQGQCFEVGFRDYALASFCLGDEALNLSLRESFACVRICTSDGFGCCAKALRVAMSFGCGVRANLFMLHRVGVSVGLSKGGFGAGSGGHFSAERWAVKSGILPPRYHFPDEGDHGDGAEVAAVF